MKILLLVSIALCAVAYAAASQTGPDKSKRPKNESGALPSPHLAGSMSLEEAIASRRSSREFSNIALTMDEISQLCWAAQGITDKRSGLRASPSAGALYPIELYVVLPGGMYQYRPDSHKIDPHIEGDMRKALQSAALDQEVVGDAPACFVVAAVIDRTAKKYGTRAERYCFMEAGHVGQNILLQAASLGLAGVPVGAFEDRQCAATLKLPKGQRVLYLLPIGHPK